MAAQIRGLGEQIVAEASDSCHAPMIQSMGQQIRVGQGVDVHAFEAEGSDSGRTLHLACLEWPGERALEGHSDADVVAHAICDALLTASGIGDLGGVFGTSDPKWAGASGESMLRETKRLLDANGWSIENVVVQMIGEGPRIAPRRDEAAAALSEALGGAEVTLAATTTDKLGFLGREEGLAALATALLTR